MLADRTQSCRTLPLRRKPKVLEGDRPAVRRRLLARGGDDGVRHVGAGSDALERNGANRVCPLFAPTSEMRVRFPSGIEIRL